MERLLGRLARRDAWLTLDEQKRWGVEICLGSTFIGFPPWRRPRDCRRERGRRGRPVRRAL